MKLAVKCLVTGLLLWIAFRTVDVGLVSALLARLDPWWAAAALALTGIIIVADAFLLAMILRLFERRLKFATALLYSIVGWFFSNVAPSTVGGDLFRGVQLSRVGMTAGAAARVVISQRALSFVTLVLVMMAGFPLALRLAGSTRDLIPLGCILLIAIAASGALLLLIHLPVLKHRWAWIGKFETASRDFRRLLIPNAQVAAAWAAALLQHLVRVLILACLAAGLNFDISISALFALTPAALLVAMLPVSLGGWGVRELTFVYFLSVASVGAEAALTLSIAFGLVRLVVGLIGGLTWVAMNDDHFRVDASSV